MAQETFNPINYGFEWTEDWYKWDSKAAHSAALKARNARKKELAKRGVQAKGWSSSGQLMSRGGIGSGHPHIEEICTVYHLDY